LTLSLGFAQVRLRSGREHTLHVFVHDDAPFAPHLRARTTLVPVDVLQKWQAEGDDGAQDFLNPALEQIVLVPKVRIERRLAFSHTAAIGPSATSSFARRTSLSAHPCSTLDAEQAHSRSLPNSESAPTEAFSASTRRPR